MFSILTALSMTVSTIVLVITGIFGQGGEGAGGSPPRDGGGRGAGGVTLSFLGKVVGPLDLLLNIHGP